MFCSADNVAPPALSGLSETASCVKKKKVFFFPPHFPKRDIFLSRVTLDLYLVLMPYCHVYIKLEGFSALEICLEHFSGQQNKGFKSPAKCGLMTGEALCQTGLKGAAADCLSKHSRRNS